MAMINTNEIPMSYVFTKSPTCVVCGKEVVSMLPDLSDEEVLEILKTNNFLEDVDQLLNNRIYVICSPVDGGSLCLDLFTCCPTSYGNKGVYIDDPEKQRVLSGAFSS